MEIGVITIEIIKSTRPKEMTRKVTIEKKAGNLSKGISKLREIRENE